MSFILTIRFILSIISSQLLPLSSELGKFIRLTDTFSFTNYVHLLNNVFGLVPVMECNKVYYSVAALSNNFKMVKM